MVCRTDWPYAAIWKISKRAARIKSILITSKNHVKVPSLLDILINMTSEQIMFWGTGNMP